MILEFKLSMICILQCSGEDWLSTSILPMKPNSGEKESDLDNSR